MSIGPFSLIIQAIGEAIDTFMTKKDLRMRKIYTPLK